MERDFHIDDFERLLKEKADEFRMYPSKRIWHSVYNNIHPGRKWPSVVMSITLITSLVLVGYLNTGNTHLYNDSGNNTIQKNTIGQENTLQLLAYSSVNFSGNSNKESVNAPLSKTVPTSNNRTSNLRIIHKKPAKSTSLTSAPLLIQKQILPEDLEAYKGSNDFSQSGKNENDVSTPLNNAQVLPVGQIEIVNVISDNIKKTTDDEQTEGLSYSQKIAINSLAKISVLNEFAGTKNETTGIIQSGNFIVEKNNLAVNQHDIISAEDKDWIEHYALYNKPATRKWANRLFWQTYVTPSVVYRKLNSFTDINNMVTATPFANSAYTQNLNNSVKQKPSFGIEIGTGLQYSINKSLKLKTGLQLNFTRYNSEAFQNSHPVTSMLTMHDISTGSYYQVYRSTPYSNKSGLESIKLHNQTFQISIPIGADLKLIGNENLQWNIGATIQPTYVFGGKSYLLSSDRNNYVKETSLLNRWNLNAGFETFITFKSKGLTWQVGPQFRSQLFSTNSKVFAIEERLLNYGLKFGVTKIIK